MRKSLPKARRFKRRDDDLALRLDLETACDSLTKHATETIETVQNRFESSTSEGGTCCSVMSKP